MIKLPPKDKQADRRTDRRPSQQTRTHPKAASHRRSSYQLTNHNQTSIKMNIIGGEKRGARLASLQGRDNARQPSNREALFNLLEGGRFGRHLLSEHRLSGMYSQVRALSGLRHCHVVPVMRYLSKKTGWPARH